VHPALAGACAAEILTRAQRAGGVSVLQGLGKHRGAQEAAIQRLGTDGHRWSGGTTRTTKQLLFLFAYSRRQRGHNVKPKNTREKGRHRDTYREFGN
jgi:hypothetical protein